MPQRASYRVQVRDMGEPWRTVTKVNLLEIADAEAERLAVLKVMHGEHTFPRHQFVRVVCGDQVCWSRTLQEYVRQEIGAALGEGA